jgi:rhodanese-related sulfurtransferase
MRARYSRRSKRSAKTGTTARATRNENADREAKERLPMDHSPRFLKIVNDTKSRVREVTVDHVKSKLARGDSFELVDVREESEWAAGHVKGARHLGRGILERDIEKAIPDPAREIIVYCGGGFRSALAAESLQRMGYTNVASMDGGWRVWNERGGPTE